MNNTKKNLILAALLLTLTSCGGGDQPNVTSGSNNVPSSNKLDAEITQAQVDKYVLNLGTNIEYNKTNNYAFNDLENKMNEKDSTVSSYKELAEYLDYQVFYHVESTEVNLDFKHSTKVNEVLNEAYWLSELIPGAVGIDGSLDKDMLTVKFYYYDYASITAKNIVSKDTPIIGLTTSVTSARDNDYKYPYEKYEQIVDVYNSEQLWYALEHNYKVNVIENSPAEKCLYKGKEILNSIVDDNMSELEKITNIQTYIISNTHYDNEGDEYCTTLINNENSKGASVKQPDQSAALFDSFFMEGVLFSHHGVCHGFAKTFNFLLNLEGIESYRVTGIDQSYQNKITRNPIYIGSGTYQDHSYNYINYNNQYYRSDITFAYAGTYKDTNMSFYRNLCLLMSKRDHKKVYTSGFNDRFDKEVSETSVNFYEELKYTYNGVENDLELNSLEEVTNYAEYIFSIIQGMDSKLFALQFSYNNSSYLMSLADELSKKSLLLSNYYYYDIFVVEA